MRVGAAPTSASAGAVASASLEMLPLPPAAAREAKKKELEQDPKLVSELLGTIDAAADTHALEEPPAKEIASTSTDAANGSQPGVSRPRTCVSPRRCGKSLCGDCYPPGDPFQSRRKRAR